MPGQEARDFMHEVAASAGVKELVHGQKQGGTIPHLLVVINNRTEIRGSDGHGQPRSGFLPLLWLQECGLCSQECLSKPSTRPRSVSFVKAGRT